MATKKKLVVKKKVAKKKKSLRAALTKELAAAPKKRARKKVAKKTKLPPGRKVGVPLPVTFEVTLHPTHPDVAHKRFTVEEIKGTVTHKHYVYFDKYGWYCSVDGRECKAVKAAQDFDQANERAAKRTKDKTRKK